MLFNSQEFLFVFLPATLLRILARPHLPPVGDRLAHTDVAPVLRLVAAAQHPDHRAVDHHQLPSRIVPAAPEPEDEQPRLSRTVLLIGILFNVAFLGFFKYADFVYGTINDVFGANLILLHVILPLGISFITFQKIAFLIDVQAGRVKAFTFREYCTFVLFFPSSSPGRSSTIAK